MGFPTTETGGALAFRSWELAAGVGTLPVHTTPWVLSAGTPSPCSRAAAFRMCLSPQPPTSPLSPASLPPCGEADELAGRGLMGMPEPRAALLAALGSCRGRVSSASRWQGPGEGQGVHGQEVEAGGA